MQLYLKAEMSYCPRHLAATDMDGTCTEAVIDFAEMR